MLTFPSRKLIIFGVVKQVLSTGKLCNAVAVGSHAVTVSGMDVKSWDSYAVCLYTYNVTVLQS